MAIGDLQGGGMFAGNNGANDLIVSLVNVSSSRNVWAQSFSSATEYRNMHENDWDLPTSLELQFIFRNVYSFLNTDTASSIEKIRTQMYWTSDTIKGVSGTLGPITKGVIVSGMHTSQHPINSSDVESTHFVRAIRRI